MQVVPIMDSLKPTLETYLQVTKSLLETNAEAKDLRETRQTLELDLAAAYNEASFKEPLPDKIEFHKSRMTFHVKKPGEWKKGWTLSKKQLEAYLRDILPEHGENVMKEIVKRHEKTLVADDYSFELRSMEN